jgi:hypothetical protein
MQFSMLLVSVIFSLSAAVSPQLASAQDERDFVFTDDEGHLVLRYAGAEAGNLDDDQIEEIVNVQLSTMVHYRLRADSVFEAEPVDLDWADSIEHQIEIHVNAIEHEFSEIDIKCRSTSCRLLFGHSDGWSVSEHQSLMGNAQMLIRAFIEANSAGFEPVFLIAAHFQEPEKPYLKLFLQRTAAQN